MNNKQSTFFEPKNLSAFGTMVNTNQPINANMQIEKLPEKTEMTFFQKVIKFFKDIWNWFIGLFQKK